MSQEKSSSKRFCVQFPLGVGLREEESRTRNIKNKCAQSTVLFSENNSPQVSYCWHRVKYNGAHVYCQGLNTVHTPPGQQEPSEDQANKSNLKTRPTRTIKRPGQQESSKDQANKTLQKQSKDQANKNHLKTRPTRTIKEYVRVYAYCRQSQSTEMLVLPVAGGYLIPKWLVISDGYQIPNGWWELRSDWFPWQRW